MANKLHIVNKLKRMISDKPLVRGMAMYSVTWPVGSLIQQTFESEEYSIARTLRFSLYGSLYVAPSLYGWMRFSCYILPKSTIGYTIAKAYLEQLTYAPFAICSFFFIMTILEGGSIRNGIEEINKKLIPTWKISAAMWPVLQSINYTFIPEKNRVPFIGLCSLAWTIFLTFVKYQDNVFELEVKRHRS